MRFSAVVPISFQRDSKAALESLHSTTPAPKSVKDGIDIVQRTTLRKAEAAISAGNWSLALELLEQFNTAAWKANNLSALSEVCAARVSAACQRRLTQGILWQSFSMIVGIHASRGYEGHDAFMIYAERWQSIAADANRVDHEGRAIEAQAQGMTRKFMYRSVEACLSVCSTRESDSLFATRRALEKFEVALDHWTKVRDELGKARAYRGMEVCLRELHEPFRAAEFAEKARTREEHVQDQIREVNNVLTSYENQLVGVTVKMVSLVIQSGTTRPYR